MIALILGISTLTLNIAIACWLSTTGDSSGQLVVFRRKSCKSSRTVIFAVHLVINVFATLLLSASNYCMQLLSSPLREEVDIAHAAKNWKYIGVPNFRILQHISWTRRLLRLNLAISSPPVHLLWRLYKRYPRITIIWPWYPRISSWALQSNLNLSAFYTGCSLIIMQMCLKENGISLCSKIRLILL